MANPEPDPELCRKYAQFASHLEKSQFLIIYWTMFITNLFVLFLASWSYTKYVVREPLSLGRSALIADQLSSFLEHRLWQSDSRTMQRRRKR